MARSTQMRLDSITGSLVAIDAVSSAKAAPAAIAQTDLEGVLGEFAGAIKRIHGDAAFTNQTAGRFDHVAAQFTGHISASNDIVGGRDLALTRNADVGGTSDLHGRVKAYVAAEVVGALTASNDMLLNKAGATFVTKSGGHVVFDVQGTNAFKIKANGSAQLDVTPGDVHAYGTLDVDGRATLNSALVESMSTTAGALVFHDASKVLADNINVKFDGSHLYAPGVKVSDLTPGRVVFAGASEELADASEMTYSAGVLTVSGSTFSKDVTIVGNLTVQGATVTVDTENLVVKDAKIVVSSGGIVDGVGLYLASDTSGENIRWSTADGGKWIASDKLAADELQALDLSSAIVWADASGNLTEITAANLGAAVNAELAGTSNQINISAPDATTGISTLSLPQSIDTNADVEFDTLKLGDYAADAGKAYMIGASGSIVPAAYDQFVMVAPDLGLSTSQDGFKIKITQSQDLRSSASPEFAAINLGSYGDLLASGSDLKIQAAAYIKFADAQGNYELAKAGEYATFDAAFAATSIVGALCELAAGSGGGKGKWSEVLASDTAGAYTLTGPDWSAAGFDMSRVDIYLNGQLMKMTEDYALSGSAVVTFTFALKADDVVTARIC